MNNRIALFFAALGLLVLTFIAGVYAQREYQLAQIRAAEKVAREFTGLDDPITPPPSFESWRYPQAKVLGKIDGQILTVMGQPERHGGHYLVLTTPDAFDDVARFYAEQALFENPEEAAKSLAATSASGTLQGKAEYVMDNNTSALDPNQSRPVRVKCLAGRNRSFNVTVFITRAADEQQTHVVLLYDPLVEVPGEPNGNLPHYRQRTD